MNDFLEGLGGGGALTTSGLLLLVVLMVLRGNLVTRRQLDDQRQETAYWRAAHGVEVEARQQATAQVTDLLEQGKTTAALIRSLRLPPVEEPREPTGGTS